MDNLSSKLCSQLDKSEGTGLFILHGDAETGIHGFQTGEVASRNTLGGVVESSTHSKEPRASGQKGIVLVFGLFERVFDGFEKDRVLVVRVLDQEHVRKGACFVHTSHKDENDNEDVDDEKEDDEELWQFGNQTETEHCELWIRMQGRSEDARLVFIATERAQRPLYTRK